MDFRCVGKVDTVQIYPVKSCRGQYVSSWPISKRGLLHDREFAVFSAEKQRCISLKIDTRLRHIEPFVDLERQKLRLTCVERENRFDNGKERDVIPEFPPIEIDIETEDALLRRADSEAFDAIVQSEKIAVVECGKEAREFVERVFGEDGFTLVRNSFERRFSRGKKTTIAEIEEGYSRAQTDAERDQLDRMRELIAAAERSKVALPNEAQYLILTNTSLKSLVDAVNENLGGDFSRSRMIDRMRPNVIVEDNLTSTFEEERWRHVKFGSEPNVSLNVTGACKRCPIVAVEIDTGMVDPEPLGTLDRIRSKYQYFGLHANNSEEQRHELKTLVQAGKSAPHISVGDSVFASERW